VSSSSRTGVDDEGPREPVRRHWKVAMGTTNTFTPPSCAASFTCSPLHVSTATRSDSDKRWRFASAGATRTLRVSTYTVARPFE